MLEAIELTRRFGAVVALDGLSLRVARGEVVCLLGANGAGKSTAINCFLGFVTPTSGRALVDGADVARDAVAARRRLAYVPDRVALYPRLSGLENLGYFGALAGRRLPRVALLEMLEAVGLPAETADRRAETYSHGLRQRIGLAIALVKDAGALLLDEPTAGLDPAASTEFSSRLRRLADGGLAVLAATHDLVHVSLVATRVVVLSGGRLAVDVSAAGLGVRALHELTLAPCEDGGP